MTQVEVPEQGVEGPVRTKPSKGDGGRHPIAHFDRQYLPSYLAPQLHNIPCQGAQGVPILQPSIPLQNTYRRLSMTEHISCSPGPRISCIPQAKLGGGGAARAPGLIFPPFLHTSQTPSLPYDRRQGLAKWLQCQRLRMRSMTALDVEVRGAKTHKPTWTCWP